MAKKKAAKKDNEKEQKREGLEHHVSGENVETLNEELNKLREEKLRLLAEIQNLHKRYSKEIEDAKVSERKKVILEIAEIIDLTLTAFDSAENSQDENLAQGMKMIKEELMKRLKNLGVEIQNPVGEKFDYRLHHALSVKETEQEDETVVEVVKRGIVYRGEVLRPSLVIVSKKIEKN